MVYIVQQVYIDVLVLIHRTIVWAKKKEKDNNNNNNLKIVQKQREEIMHSAKFS